MRDIVGNAIGFTKVPTEDELAQATAALSLDDLLAKDTNCPMLVINGDQDVHVPITDTQIFEGRRDTDVLLIGGAGHCAFDKLDELEAQCLRWLTTHLHAPVALATH